MVVHITGGGHFELCAYRPLGGYPILFAVFFENSIPICNTMQNYKNLSPSAQSFWIPSQLIHYILYSLVLILYLKCGGGLGGGGGNVFLIFYAIYNISRKNNFGNTKFFFEKNNYFSFNVFFMFFYAGNIEKCPFTYWLNGRWFLQIVDIGNFNIRLEILKSAPSLTG